MSKLTAKLRKLATDCRSCRHGFCCGQCLCCISEEKLGAIVQEARGEAAIANTKTKLPRSRRKVAL